MTMIKIKNLYKTYNKNKKNECKAIRGISFELNNKGMVFITGKSGSGKSTLLNILGGLDSSTSGKIVFDNQDISKFTPKQMESYRNNHVGFVFQDFCLIEGMTVYENIEIALSLQNKFDHSLVIQTIREVGLSDKKDTPVNLLSGGQKQRVAIARALVKSPSFILADEPTGNLDTKTANQIFSILKKLSKDKLVVVISHNLVDADKYADRIIEISSGQIVDDVDNICIEEDNIAILSQNAKMSDEELKIVNDTIKDHDIEIVRKQSQHIQHRDKQINNIICADLNNKNKMLFSSKLKLFKYFFKKKILGMLMMIVLITMLITLMGLCQTFNQINDTKLLLDAIEEDSSPLIFQKGSYNDYLEKLDTSYLGKVTDEDISTFIFNGYDGQLFKLYRYSIPLIGNYDNICFGKEDGFNISGGMYLSNNGVGVLQCSQEYLTELYGIDGKLNVLSGSLDDQDYGILVTDYFADCILNKDKNYISNTGDKYAKLTSSTEPIARRYKINAVISTNYLERYSWLVDKFKMAATYPAEQQKYIDEIKNNDLTYNFINEVNNYLSVGYTFNENFIEDTLAVPRDACHIHYFENIEITTGDNEVLLSNNYVWQCVDGIDLTENKKLNIQDNEIYLSAELYNRLFDTNLTFSNPEGFEEKEITYNLYSSDRKYGDEAKYSKSFVIKGLIPHKSEYASAVSDNTFKELRRADMSAYALYAYGGTNNAVLYQNSESLHYESSSEYVKTIQSIIKTIKVFQDIFEIIFIGLFAASLFILSTYITKNILSWKREIGILRAIGSKSADTTTPFNILSIVIGLLSAIFSVLGFSFICNLTNTIITERFATNFNLPALLDIKFITFNPAILVVDLLILFGVIAICSLTPIITMKKIKPIDIMRKE